MFATTFSRCNAPSMVVRTLSCARSPTSSRVTSSGPNEKKVSKLFARVKKRGLRWRMSSAVMSMIVVTPATASSAFASSRKRAGGPMIRPSSASPVVRSDCGGIRTSSSGPTIEVAGFMNVAGSSGRFSPRSPACSA